MATSEEECLEALREAAKRLGESPTKAQYESIEITPSSTTIVRVVGGWNEAKGRAELETYTQEESGGTDIEPRPDGVDIPAESDWEELTPQQRWYYRNRDHRIACKESRRQELRAWFERYKREECECRRCGESTPECLDFHHVGTKESGVSQMVNHGYSKERILAEIEDCVVLCANCHRKQHRMVNPMEDEERRSGPPDATTTEGSWPSEERPQRAFVERYKCRSDGCRDCGETDPDCLDFHHVGDKRAGVGRMVSNHRPVDDIRAEVERCELLCANCHRREHRNDGRCTE